MNEFSFWCRSESETRNEKKYAFRLESWEFIHVNNLSVNFGSSLFSGDCLVIY